MDVDDTAAQQQAHQRWFETVAAHRLMAGLSYRPGQVDRDPMLRLLNQAHRAHQRSVDAFGLDCLNCPF
jgi:hypothetical protein